ncbi:hypothetical protein D0868_11067 [Hortaea werneckii]|uniref:LysM domain-containing protein n=1 Tax=Hortaea werneckii TaxID=91943 RepID=A0A3M6Y1J9_HORWE|nr:hypothetical protein D0868_11067 [Hortaea werneckii]
MSLHGLAYTVLLAVPALAVPRPNSPRSLSARQVTETTTLPGITQTSTETAYTRPTCTKTVFYSPNDTCDDIATPFQFQLGIADGCLSANSQHCKDVLSIYRICLSPADDVPALSSGSSTSDSVYATMTPSPNASVVLNLETRTSWTTTTTQTTVYYMVVGSRRLHEHARTYPYDYELAFDIERGGRYSCGYKLIAGIEHGRRYFCGYELIAGIKHGRRHFYGYKLIVGIEHGRRYFYGYELIIGIEHGRSYLYGYKLLFGIKHRGSSSCSYKLNLGIEHAQPDLDLSRAYRINRADRELRVADALTQRASTCGTAQPHAATQAGIVSDCTQWYVAQSGDYCYSVAERFGISVDTFMGWNPAVDPPACPNMLAGFAYCVATCDNPQVSSVASTLTPASTASASSPTATGNGLDTYTTFTGNGTVGAGWPEMSEWVDFDYMFTANRANMQASCAVWNVPNDSDEEIADLKTAILDLASSTGVDARFILAIVMQESTGCVRVITTQYSHFNPGLMQSHNGTGSCNTNMAAIGLPGVESEGSVQTPCPYSEIHQMIEDGTAGTSSGDGLQQILAAQTTTDVSRFYRAARTYNGGSVDPSGDLGRGCCTLCYASDVANRLTGWVDAPHTCNL